jgi:hypothetical protein
MNTTTGERIKSVFQEKEKDKKWQKKSLKDAQELLEKLNQAEESSSENSKELRNNERAGYFQSLAERLSYEKNIEEFFAEEAGRGIVKKVWESKLEEGTFYEEIQRLYDGYIERAAEQKDAQEAVQQTFYYLASCIRIENKLKESEANDQ